MSGDVIGWAKIEGPKPGQEIWINNYGLPERPDFRNMIYEDAKLVCHNWHFKSPQDCLLGAREWSLKSDRRPSLRRFEWYPGHDAHVVDGLIDTQVIIVETTPGEFRMHIKLNNGRVFWHDAVWSSPEDALRV